MAAHAMRTHSKRRIRFDEHLPVDHRLNLVYRIGAGLMGLGLLVFGIFGITRRDSMNWESPIPSPASRHRQR